MLTTTRPAPAEAHGKARRATDEAAAPDLYRHATLACAEVAAAALAEEHDLDSVLHLIAEQACAVVGVTRCSLYLHDERTERFRGQVGHPLHEIDKAVKALTVGGEGDAFTREIVETRAPVITTNAMDDPRTVRSTMRTWDVQSMLGIPLIFRDDVIGIMFLDREGDRRAFSPVSVEIGSMFASLAAVAIMQARANEAARTSLQTATAQGNVLRRAVAIDDRLAALALAAAGLAETAEAVSEISGRAVAIYDAAHERRELALPPQSEADLVHSLLPRAFHPQAEIRAALEEAAAAGATVIGPFPDSGLLHRLLVAPVVVGDVLWGHLACAELDRRFGALDKHVLRRAATNVALELAAERRASASEWDGRASLASALLRDDREAEAQRKRAEFLGIDLRASYLVCLVAPESAEDPDSAPTARELADALTHAGEPGPVLTTNAPEGVAAILQLPEADSPEQAVAEIRARIVAALGRLSAGRTALVAISTAGADASACPRGYEEARQVLKCMRAFASPGAPRVLTADDLGAGRVFIASVDPAEATSFTEQTLGGLLHDSPTARDLLGTLQTFFEASRSIRKAADSLGIHENTVRYRLTRITTETGLDVANSSHDQLTAQMALMVLQLQGRCPWNRPAST
jgi:sugar diacid utilization regulator